MNEILFHVSRKLETTKDSIEKLIVLDYNNYDIVKTAPSKGYIENIIGEMPSIAELQYYCQEVKKGCLDDYLLELVFCKLIPVLEGICELYIGEDIDKNVIESKREIVRRFFSLEWGVDSWSDIELRELNERLKRKEESGEAFDRFDFKETQTKIILWEITSTIPILCSGKQNIDVPKKLDTQEAREIIGRAIDEGLFLVKSNGLAWNKTASLYGYFIDMISDRLNLKTSNDRIQWKTFEFITNHTSLVTTARQAVNDYKNKGLQPPEGDDIVNDILK